ncbi:MAG: T9SS type A sorting domain-containing protein [Flavobacteriales bacterium]|nr:T9SS type A sorting domain-containing protein [Flavobacteriales bacterium]
MGGEGYEEATSIGVDSNGAIYVSGYFNQPGDYDPGEAEYQLTSNGGQDAFIVKLNPSGGFEWAHHFGSDEQLLSLGMDVNDFGDVFLTGPFQGTVDFNPGEDETLLEVESGQGGFVLKLNSAGEFGYATAFGGDQNDTPWDIAVDAAGNAYSAGGFRGEFTAGGTTLTGVDFNEEAFVVKVNPFGTVEWVKAIQGVNFQNAYDVNTDQSGNVILAGYFGGTADFNTDEDETLEFTKESAEPFDAFYTVLDGDGNFVHAGQFGGSNFTEHHGVDTDTDGNVYLGAAFQGTVDLNPNPDETDDASVVEFRDSYVVKLSPDDFIGVDYQANAPTLSVFPNPAVDVLNIEISAKNSAYSIRDMAGREVHRGLLNRAELAQISVSDLTPGAYIILVDGFAPLKWIKQ